MRRVTLLFALSLALPMGHAVALQGKSADAPGQVKKRAHGDIKKWVKARGRLLKGELELYDKFCLHGVHSKDALVMMKIVIEHDLAKDNLGSFVRLQVKNGVKGKSLAASIHKEVKLRRDKKIKLKAKDKGAKEAGGKKSPEKPEGKSDKKGKDKPKGESGGKSKGKSKGKKGK